MSEATTATNAVRVVVKVGGDILLDESERAGLCANIKALTEGGAKVCLLHGGGPQVNALQEKLGLSPNKIGGRRVTSKEDLRVVHQAICGEVNVALTSALRAAGVRALGTHGAAAGLLQAKKRPPMVVSGGPETPVDFGEVGDVSHVDTSVVTDLWAQDFVPVVATLAAGAGAESARTFNINADDTSVELAIALQATALLMVTQVGGVFRDIDDKDSRIEAIDAKEARALIESGVIVGGMIPKVERALTALASGVGAVSIIGAQHPGAFSRIAFGQTAEGPPFGTTLRG